LLRTAVRKRTPLPCEPELFSKKRRLAGG
jgi:hypothetical protein